MKIMNKALQRVLLLTICLLLAFSAARPMAAIASTEDMDARDLGNFVILDDPELMGDPLSVFSEMETPTDEPTAEPTQAPTTAPTEEPTPPPTSQPIPSYGIQMSPPSGWYASRAVMEIWIEDLGGTGWVSVKITMTRTSGTVTLIDGALSSGHIWIDLLENCTVETIVTDSNGGKHSKKATVNCFDKTNPTISTSISGEYLNITATDGESDIAAIQVNGTKYTELNEGKLKIWLKEYADAYEQLIVQAVDKVGNVSKAIAVANPFFKNTVTPTKAPVATPTPTKKPSSGSSGSSSGGGSSSSGSGGSGSATATPTPTPTPSPSPTPTAEAMPSTLPTSAATLETGYPFSQTGNSFTRDLLYDRYTNKQFIGVETRNGDIFYIIIDYDKPMDDKGERYETYFLNLVDSRDMLDIVGESATKEPEVIYVTPEPTAQPTPTPVVPEPEKKDSGNGSMLGIVGLLMVAAGGALWYFKFRKPSGGKSKSSFDDYDFDDDDEDEDNGEDELDEDEDN